MSSCPECDAEIIVDEDDRAEMEVGDPWNCDACGSALRVAGLTPLEFDSDDEDEDDEEEDADAEEKAKEEDDDDDDEDEDADDKEDWDE